MIVDGQKIKIKWTKANKEWYINKGYVYTKTGDYFEVEPQHLSLGSHQKIKIQCDICGKLLKREYREYIKSHDEEFGDTCSACARKKFIKTCTDKYGGVGLQSPVIKEQVKRTNSLKYNCDYPMQNKEVYKKVRKTQEDRYGGIGLASKITGEKIRKEIQAKYGCDNPSQNEEIKQKKKDTTRLHYGVDHIFQDKDIFKLILEKARLSIYENGNIPASKPEKHIVNMLIELYGEESCFPSYFIPPLVLDCLLIIGDVKIDVEYDGWYWHKNKATEDRKRNYKLIDLGYKVLRIKSLHELPSKDQLKESIDTLLKTNKHYKEIILDI